MGACALDLARLESSFHGRSARVPGYARKCLKGPGILVKSLDDGKREGRGAGGNFAGSGFAAGRGATPIRYMWITAWPTQGLWIEV